MPTQTEKKPILLYGLQGKNCDTMTQRQVDARLLSILAASPDAWKTQFAFLPLGSGWLDLSAVDRLPTRNVGLLVQLALDEDDQAALIIRLATLRERGLKIGIFRQPRHPVFAAAILQADLGVLNVNGHEAGTVRDFSAALRASEHEQPLQLLALNIETPDEHRRCHQWHFDFFHGPFAVNAPPRPESAQADPHKIQLLHLLHLVQGEAETAELAEAMKQDPLLTFRIPIRMLGHRMKGDGGGYGFDQISVIGDQLERAAMAHNLSALHPQLNGLKDFLARVEIVYVH